MVELVHIFRRYYLNFRVFLQDLLWLKNVKFYILTIRLVVAQLGIASYFSRYYIKQPDCIPRGHAQPFGVGFCLVCSGISGSKFSSERNSKRPAATEPLKLGQSMYFGQNMPDRTRPDLEFRVDKCAIIFVPDSRNRELRARMGNLGHECGPVLLVAAQECMQNIIVTRAPGFRTTSLTVPKLWTFSYWWRSVWLFVCFEHVSCWKCSGTTHTYDPYSLTSLKFCLHYFRSLRRFWRISIPSTSSIRMLLIALREWSLSCYGDQAIWKKLECLSFLILPPVNSFKH